MTKCDLFIHKRKTSLGTRCSTLPGSLRCWCYERIMWRAARRTWENRRAGVRSAARGQYDANRQ
jgi:hypothetical protein